MEAVPVDQREKKSSKAFKQKRTNIKPKCFFMCFGFQQNACVHKNMRDILLCIRI